MRDNTRPVQRKKLIVSKQTIKTLQTKSDLKAGQPRASVSDSNASDICSTIR